MLVELEKCREWKNTCTRKNHQTWFRNKPNTGKKSVFFFPILSLFLGKGFMTRSYVSSHMERENPRDTCTFASFAPTVCRKNFFSKFQNRYIFHRDERMYKLSISIRNFATSMKKKKKIIHSLVKRIVSSLLDVSPYGCNSFIFRLIKYKI